MSYEVWGDDDDGTGPMRDHIIKTLLEDGWLDEEKAAELQAELATLRAENERLLDALDQFIRASYPVADAINPRGHNWCESWLDEARANAVAAIAKATGEQA